MKPEDAAWFRPLWLRVVVTGGLAIWCAIEWWIGDAFWGMLTGAALAYSLYNFFYAFPRDNGGTLPPSEDSKS